jgi:pimeloyl-ACP methyl ester carboxylesterase
MLPNNLLHQTILLEDGRTLGFAQYGDPAGKAVFFFHGQPGNRLFHPNNTVTLEAGVNLIVPDRPGYGLSSYQPDRTLLDWPADLYQLTKALNVTMFDVIGYSAGGPYALACAASMPAILNQVLLISSAPPLTQRELRQKMPSLLRFNYFLTKFSPGLLQLIFKLYWQQAVRNPAAFIEMTKRNLPQLDLEAITQPDIAEMMLECWKENLRMDSRGYVQDAILVFSDWGFNLAEIEKEVILYWGEDDRNNPTTSLAYLQKNLPNTHTILVENAGHFNFLLNWGDVLMLFND